MTNDDCRTHTSRQMELNAKSNQKSDGWTEQKLNAPLQYRDRGMNI